MNEDSDKTEFTEAKALSFFAWHLDEWNYPYRKSAKNSVLLSSYCGNDVFWDFNMIVRTKGNGLFHLSVNSFIPNKTRTERLAAVAELISRINCELELGCFELDYFDGGIRFRTNIILPAADITLGIVEHLLRSNISIVEERFLQIMAVLYCNVPAEEALKLKDAEADGHTPPRFNFN
jgi:hypothetical protein